MLRDIEIRNYRSFKDFQMGGFAPVNLVVGMNNSGKTSLLEAIYLLACQDDPQRLLELLHHRGEVANRYVGARVPTELSRRASGYHIAHIFHGHTSNPIQEIQLRSKLERPLSLQLSLRPIAQQTSLLNDEAEEELALWGLRYLYGSNTEALIPVRDDSTVEARSFRLLPKGELPHRFLTTSNLDFGQLAELWDDITLTPKEEKIIQALQILDPDVERLSFTSRQTTNSGILLKMRGQTEPVPLGSMGDGMRRILTLVASAVAAENGILLVDEIDTGLYYRAQAQVWKLLITIAQQLNLQIFATTHSLDCVRAFQETLTEFADDATGRLFRLSLRSHHVEPVTYPLADLILAMRENIEVR